MLRLAPINGAWLKPRGMSPQWTTAGSCPTAAGNGSPVPGYAWIRLGPVIHAPPDLIPKPIPHMLRPQTRLQLSYSASSGCSFRQRAAVAKGHESETGRKKQLAAQNGTNESQQRRVPVNPESSSNKFTPEEDAVTGFPMDPLVVDNGHAHRVPLINDGRSSSTLGRSSGTDPNAQRFYTSQIAAAEMSNPSTATGHQGNTGEWHKEEPNPVLRTIDASRGKHGRDP
ncbi:hypothetical protein D1007_14443 [Hordeum vulgare]|nr:hypothetical protein D1007_14443 [Hordeum vulgare]